MLLAIRRRLLGASDDDARDQDEGGTTNIHTLLIYSRRKQLREPNCFRIVFHDSAQTASIGASQSEQTRLLKAIGLGFFPWLFPSVQFSFWFRMEKPAPFRHPWVQRVIDAKN